MKKSKTPDSVTVNRRAHYDYVLSDELECGMALSGLEVRSIRDHHVQLKGSFVTIRNGELWLNNLTLGADTARNIKLLATRKQIAANMMRYRSVSSFNEYEIAVKRYTALPH